MRYLKGIIEAVISEPSAYSPIATDVEKTEAMIKAAIDVRLPLSFEDADFDQMGAVLLAALDDTLNGEEA